MNFLYIGLFGLVGLLAGLIYFLSALLTKATNQITKTNNQLLILVASRDGKPETSGGVVRALVASEKPPQGKLKGVAAKKGEKEKKPNNTNYEMTIGVK